MKSELITKYYNIHCCCPKCGSNELETTCVGFICIDYETYRDNNIAKCLCGWQGIVDNLIQSDIKIISN